MSVNISSNPWHVSSLQDFQYFCCPECDSRLKDTQTFIDHAVLLHEQAKETLVNLHLIPQPIEVKTEIQDVYEYEELECDEDPLYNASDVIIPTIEPIKQEFQQVNSESFIKQEIVEVKEDFSETEAKSDLVTDAKSDSRYECDQCPKSYKNKVSLDKHVRAKHRDSFKSYKCDICQRICGSQTTLDYHVTTHYLSESTNKMLKCDHCSYSTYKGTSDFKKHLAEKHGIGEAKFKCDICNKVCSSRGHLKNHRESVHGEASGIKIKNENVKDDTNGKKRFKCKLCSKSYKSKCALKTHMQSEHDDDYSPFK